MTYQSNIVKAVAHTLHRFLYDDKGFEECSENLYPGVYLEDAITKFCNQLEYNTLQCAPLSNLPSAPVINFASGITPGVLASSFLISIYYQYPDMILTEFDNNSHERYIEYQINSPRFRQIQQFLINLKKRVSYFILNKTFDPETIKSFLFDDFSVVSDLMFRCKNALSPDEYQYELEQINTLIQFGALFELLVLTPVNWDFYEYAMDEHTLDLPPNIKYRSIVYLFGLMAANLYPYHYMHTTFAELWGMCLFQWIGLPTNTITTHNKFSHPCMISTFDIIGQKFHSHLELALKSRCGVAVMLCGTRCKTHKDIDVLVKPLYDCFRSNIQQGRNSGLLFSWRPETLDGLCVAGLVKRFGSLPGLHTQVVIGSQYFEDTDGLYFVVDYSMLAPTQIALFVEEVFGTAHQYNNFFLKELPQLYADKKLSFLEFSERAKYMLNLQFTVINAFRYPNIQYPVEIFVVDKAQIKKFINAVLASNEDSYASSSDNFWKKHPNKQFHGANLCMEIVIPPETVCSIGLLNLAPFINLENPKIMLDNYAAVAGALDMWEDYPVKSDSGKVTLQPFNQIHAIFSTTPHKDIIAIYPDFCHKPTRLLEVVARVAQTLQLVLRSHNMNMRIPVESGGYELLYKKTNENANIAMGTRGEHLFVSVGRTAGERTALLGRLEEIWSILNNVFADLKKTCVPLFDLVKLPPKKLPNYDYFKNLKDIGRTWMFHSDRDITAKELKNGAHPNQNSKASILATKLNSTSKASASYDEVVSAFNLTHIMSLNLGYENPKKIPPCGYTTAVMPSERLKYLMRHEGQVQGMPLILATQFTSNTRMGTYKITMPAIYALILAHSPTPDKFAEALCDFLNNRGNLFNRFMRLDSLSPHTQIDLWAWRNQFIAQSVSLMLYIPTDKRSDAIEDQLMYGHKKGLITLHYYKDTLDTSLHNQFNWLISGQGYSTKVV